MSMMMMTPINTRESAHEAHLGIIRELMIDHYRADSESKQLQPWITKAISLAHAEFQGSIPDIQQLRDFFPIEKLEDIIRREAEAD